jgi:hypothetical protein
VLRIGAACWGLPPEALVAGAALVATLLGLCFGLPLVLPDRAGLGFVERHYFRPVILALVIQTAALALRWRTRGGSAGERWRDKLAPVGLLLVTVLVHFNLKAWMPLVHSRLFDAELQASDWGFGELVPWFIALRQRLAAGFVHVGLDLDPLYHHAFVAMFFTSFMAHGALGSARNFRRVVLAVSLVLLLGGVLYWVLPAKGPFVFRPSESHDAAQAQQQMAVAFDTFVRTRVPPPGYFTLPLAAMPSLHVAHATLFTALAFRRFPWLGACFLVVLLFILVEAVASGWHYVLDLPVGALLAGACLWLAERLLPEIPEHTPCVAPLRAT